MTKSDFLPKENRYKSDQIPFKLSHVNLRAGPTNPGPAQVQAEGRNPGH